MNHLPAQSKWDYSPKTQKKCSKKIFLKILNRHEQLAKDDDYYWYGIFEKKTGAIFGQIDFDVFVRSTHQFANFGYVIYNRYWFEGSCDLT